LSTAGAGILHVVATPIGNLEDITLRALRVLRECDAVVAEDTRRTRHLLTAHGLARQLLSLPAHDEAGRVPALVALLALAFGLRLWGVKQGLPYSYNVDEATHFVPRAIAYFGHDYNPQYFLNPPAYSYLLHIVFELWFGSGDAVRRLYAADPTNVFVVARVVAAALGTVSVWLTYLAGARLFNRTTGLLAAAIFGLAFLPIFYSHLALNDVPTLAPVANAEGCSQGSKPSG